MWDDTRFECVSDVVWERLAQLDGDTVYVDSDFNPTVDTTYGRTSDEQLAEQLQQQEVEKPHSFQKYLYTPWEPHSFRV